jgi:hypothetical protein
VSGGELACGPSPARIVEGIAGSGASVAGVGAKSLRIACGLRASALRIEVISDQRDRAAY